MFNNSPSLHSHPISSHPRWGYSLEKCSLKKPIATVTVRALQGCQASAWATDSHWSQDTRGRGWTLFSRRSVEVPWHVCCSVSHSASFMPHESLSSFRVWNNPPPSGTVRLHSGLYFTGSSIRGQFKAFTQQLISNQILNIIIEEWQI